MQLNTAQLLQVVSSQDQIVFLEVAQRHGSQWQIFCCIESHMVLGDDAVRELEAFRSAEDAARPNTVPLRSPLAEVLYDTMLHTMLWLLDQSCSASSAIQENLRGSALFCPRTLV